jgi:hypothetical protein
MRRFGRWIRSNAEGFLALAIAIVFGLLTVLDVLGPNSGAINGAILLTLAMVCVTLLRDRSSVERALLNVAAVRLVSGPEVGQAQAEARSNTDRWIFKGGTGGFLRTVTLPKCVENARQERRPLRVQLEIIDPTEDALCEEYARFRSSLTPAPGRAKEEWTRDRVRLEAYATIFAACWHRQRFAFLTVEIGLSRVMSTFRWDLSASCVIQSQEDPAGSSLIFDNGRPHYRACNRELVVSFDQSRRVHVDRADDCRLGEEPTVDEARTLFSLLQLDLPSSIGNREIQTIIRMAIGEKEAVG